MEEFVEQSGAQEQSARESLSREFAEAPPAGTGQTDATDSASGRSADTQNRGVDSIQLGQRIADLKSQGADTSALEDLAKDFHQHDLDKDGRISREEAAAFVTRDMTYQLGLSEQPGANLDASRSRANGILKAGIGGELSAELALGAVNRMDSWLKENPGHTAKEFGYSLAALSFGESLRAKMDAGLNASEMKDLIHISPQLTETFKSWPNSGMYYQSPYPDKLHEVLKKGISDPGKVDTDGDGKVKTDEIVRYWLGQRGLDTSKLSQDNCFSLGLAIPEVVPNPEWPFHEDLGNYDSEFKRADTGNDGFLGQDELKDYFKDRVWQKFDFRHPSDQTRHRLPSDPVRLSDIQWAQQSADCFGLVSPGSKDSAELVRDTLQGIQDNWSKYMDAQSGKNGLSHEQYANALKTEFSVALLDRLNKGVSFTSLKDFCDLSEKLMNQFGIGDPGLVTLANNMRQAAANPQGYDTNGDGVVKADELWATKSRVP